MRRPKWSLGLVKVQLTSAEPENALYTINLNGIQLSTVKWRNGLSCTFWIRRRDLPQLEKLSARRGDAVRVISRAGLFWNLMALRNRSLLLIGLTFLFALILFLPTRILFVRVEGNADIPKRQILDAAEACGIEFGALRRMVRSEKVKNALLSALPQLKWIGVNTKGCVAVISVQEGAAKQAGEPEYCVSSIVAALDGYILSGTVTQGNGLFHVGETVKQGEVLISGYTDCGFCIQATRAKGEVFALTKRQIGAVMLSEKQIITEKADVKRNYSLLIRKKRINLWKDSGISGSSCGRMYKEYYITLPGGFSLPVALCVESYTQYETQPSAIPEEAAKQTLDEFMREYLLQQMVAGQLRGEEIRYTPINGAYQIQGAYTCIEMIGREQQEQIGDTNGEND